MRLQPIWLPRLSGKARLLKINFRRSKDMIIGFKLTKPIICTGYQFVLLFAANMHETKLIINPLLCGNQLLKYEFITD